MSAVEKTKIAALKRAISTGIDDLENGRYRNYSDANVLLLAEDIGRSGRKRLAKSSKKTIAPR